MRGQIARGSTAGVKPPDGPDRAIAFSFLAAANAAGQVDQLADRDAVFDFINARPIQIAGDRKHPQAGKAGRRCRAAAANPRRCPR